MTVAPSQSNRSSSRSNAATLTTLNDLALGLPKVAQTQPEMRRKAERGYGPLGVTDVPQPVQAAPVTLDPAMTVEAALQRFGQRCLNHSLATNLSRWRVSPKESTKCASPSGAFVQCFPR
jgi:inorganic triphosphatase YgiF